MHSSDFSGCHRMGGKLLLTILQCTGPNKSQYVNSAGVEEPCCIVVFHCVTIPQFIYSHIS